MNIVLKMSIIDSDSDVMNAHEAYRASESVARNRIRGFIERKTLKGKTCLLVKVANVRKIEEYETSSGKERMRLCISKADLDYLKSLGYQITGIAGNSDLYYVDWTHPFVKKIAS